MCRRRCFGIEFEEYAAADGGFTDIEIRSPDLHVIVEASASTRFVVGPVVAGQATRPKKKSS
jgi:hypothetical protein